MSISCSCSYDLADADWFWEEADDFSSMPKRKKRTRCYSCRNVLNEGDTVLELYAFKECDYGERRYLASKYLCEECGEILLNLHSVGICVYLDGDLHGDLHEYWDMTGFDPEKYKGGSNGRS